MLPPRVRCGGTAGISRYYIESASRCRLFSWCSPSGSARAFAVETSPVASACGCTRASKWEAAIRWKKARSKWTPSSRSVCRILLRCWRASPAFSAWWICSRSRITAKAGTSIWSASITCRRGELLGHVPAVHLHHSRSARQILLVVRGGHGLPFPGHQLEVVLLPDDGRDLAAFRDDAQPHEEREPRPGILHRHAADLVRAFLLSARCHADARRGQLFERRQVGVRLD